MKQIVKRIITMIMALAMVCGCVVLPDPQYASAKMVSKVTKVVTLTNRKVIYHNVVTGKETVFIKVKILSTKGKVRKDENGDLSLGDIEGEGFGKGTLFNSMDKPKLKIKSFQKGKILQSNWAAIRSGGDVEIGWWPPDGVKSMKVEITYYTKNGKAGIKSVKQKERKL